MLCLLEILLLLFALNHGDLTVLAHRTAWKRVPKPSVTAAWNTSATSPLIQANGSSHVTPSDIENYNSSRGVINAAPMLPLPFANLGDWNPNKMLVNYQDVKSGFCAIGDDFCSFKDSNGTVTQATATNFSDQCLLWDSSCSGNKTMAIERFFSVSFNQSAIDDPNTNRNIINNNCFGEVGAVSQSDCDIYNPLERLADFEKIRNWMRSPQCVSAANEWITMTGYPWGYVFEGGSNASRADSSLIEPSCCGACWLVVDTVDLYYWPEPDANVSCTSIIGDNLRPLDYGATTTTLDDGDIWTYWAGDCNTTLTSMSFPGTTMIPSTYIAPLTTAMITSIGSLTVKRSFFSPWSSSPCIVDDAGSQPSNRSMEVLNEHASVYAHGHSLVVPSSVTQDNGLPVSTTISGNFTL